MRIDEPVALQMFYTRAMMSFLLFHTHPRALLLLGLGGGSLAKYCHVHLPEARIVVVESNADVLALRNEFAVPRDDDRFHVVEGDAGAFVFACRDRYDVVLMDAFDHRGLAPGLGTREFYEALRSLLRPDGILVANVAGTGAQRSDHIEGMRNVWDENMLVLSVEEDDNDVVFAFRDPTFEPRWRWIQNQAEALRRRYGIELPAFARQLKRSGSQWFPRLPR
jgi:spermidine synthase